ncbi:hypothetical protein D7X96_04830 [Corallococcus interemptor]|uniref:Nuclear transport factor 2 family protein n=1 Tax=Corallococcus interemptor TaxID=2316720 RepID=A0A3A8R5B3_9BACT|nr:hypothetical protein [Corallococcus interemptor]RKH72412.1 hypothetical protein D7X96_04830 [Corallococcus interemptor]
MNDIRLTVEAFLQWWSSPKDFPAFSTRFAPGFSYRQEPDGMSDEDAVWFHEEKVPWTGLKVVEQEIAGNTASLVLEGDDPVTLLRMRASLKLMIQGAQVVSVSERIKILD